MLYVLQYVRTQYLTKIHQSTLLALLCATAQKSYCRHAGVRRPSIVRPSSVRRHRFLGNRQVD